MKIEIDAFIEKAIIEILQGVASAHNYINEKDDSSVTGALNPFFVDEGNHSQKELIRDINFDIAINIESSSEKSGEGKAKIYVVNAGGGYKKNDTSGQVSKVQFSVPIIFPMTILRKNTKSTKGKSD